MRATPPTQGLAVERWAENNLRWLLPAPTVLVLLALTVFPSALWNLSSVKSRPKFASPTKALAAGSAGSKAWNATVTM